MANLPWQLRLRVLLTWAGLFWERLWSALWPATGFIGLYLALSLFDVWTVLPGLVQLLAFVGAFGASGWSLWQGLRGEKLPTQLEALRRIEVRGGLEHRPLSSVQDTLLDAQTDAETRALWTHHQEQQRQRLREARAAWPKSDLPARDPHAMRVLVALLLVLSLTFARGDMQNRLASALQPGFGFSVGGTAELTAWVNPPAYTRIPPMFLDEDKFAKEGTIAVPIGSELVLRVVNARGVPSLRRPAGLGRMSAEAGHGETHEITDVLTQSGAYALRDRGRTLGSWRFSVTPDAIPYAGFEELPSETPDNTLGVRYALHDDYGIDTANLHFELEPPLEGRGAGGLEAVPSDGSDEFDVELPLSSVAPKSVSELTDVDLTQHPFAGLDVIAEIRVRDLGGQTGASDKVHITLPERDFFEPLALALVEQRRNLVRDPTDWAFVMRGLEALTLAPERFFDDLTVYLGMRTVYWQLDRVMPMRREQILPTIDLLWDLALHVEDGNLSLAERELRAIAEALMEALARGAPMDEIQRLLQRYQEALERYLAALADQMLAEGNQDTEQPAGEGMTMTDQDLMDLLKAIEDLAKTGDHASAREMVAQLQRMLENMTMAQGGGMNGPESEMARRIEELSDLIGKERALMDETLRRSQGGDSQGGQPQSGEGEEQSGGSLPGLAGEQGGLRGELEAARPESGEGDDVASALDEAEEAMKDAENALKEGNGRGALHAQRRAIDRMTEAAEGLAEELMESMQARGAAQGQGEVDPLGRQEGGRGSGLGDHIKIPEERDLQRAREILEELQRRASDPDRPKMELDYLERLLKRF